MFKSALHPTYDHLWRSRTHLTERVGQKLRVLVVGMLNSALVEFEDGQHCVTSRFGYRRIAAHVDNPALPIETEEE